MSLLAEWIDSVSSTLCRISLATYTRYYYRQTAISRSRIQLVPPQPFTLLLFFLYFPSSVAAVLAIPKLLYYALYRPIYVCCSATMAPALVYY